MRLSFDSLQMIGGISIAFSLACAPQGEWARVTHPPHQAYLAQTIPSQKKIPESGNETFQRGLAGLPDICTKVANTPGSICLDCRSDHWLIQRCYEYEGKFESEASCLSTSDHLKCLLNSPVTSFNLAIKRSLEKQFQENYLLWEAKVLEIWSGRLSEKESESLRNLLLLTNELSLWLSQRDPLSMTESDWTALFPSLSKEEIHRDLPRCRQLILHLQDQRLKGQLSLLNFLREVKELLSDLKLNPQMIEYLEALSLEGLEEGL